MIKRFFKKKKVATPYSWVDINIGLFKNKSLFLPESWGDKVIKGDHESEIIEVMKSIIGESEVFYDVGAHYGWFTIAWLCLGGKYVEAFEPSKENISIITKTLEMNSLTNNVRLHNCALGESINNGFLKLYPGDSSRNYISKQKDDQSVPEEPIHIDSIDNMLNDIGLKNPDLIKIDVEGFEIEVLYGAKKLLKNLSPKLVIEIHDATNGLLVADFLSNLGYKMKILGYKGKNHSLPLVFWFKKN